MNWLNDFLLPPAKSTLAEQTDQLFWFVHLSGLALTVVLVAVIIYFLIKYRRQSDDETPPLITHNSTLEVTWSIIPMFLVLFIFGWGYKIYKKQETVPDDAYEVKVTAQQWLWQFSYENGATSTGDLHVPAGRPIKLIMNSKDVIHSFFVPDFRLKQDVVPGRKTELWFNAPKTGKSILFCTEYCGTSHSKMTGQVVVQKPEKFQNWLASNAGGSKKPSDLKPAEWGKQLAENYACTTCHSADGSKMTGPTWKGIYGHDVELKNGNTVKSDDDYIKESIYKPNAKIVKGYPVLMNSYEDQLGSDQVDAIIAYIKTLK